MFAALAEYDGKSKKSFVDYFAKKGMKETAATPFEEMVQRLQNQFQNKYVSVELPKIMSV